MFDLSIDTQNKVDTAYILYFSEEEPDPEYVAIQLAALKHQLSYIPTQFHEAILNETIYKNKISYNHYMLWCEQVMADYEDMRTGAINRRQQIIGKLSESGNQVFRETLHDGDILRVERIGDNVKVLLDMRGGFTPKSMIELTFIDAKDSGILDYNYVYDELIETATGFGLRVLSGSPYLQWTIFFKDVTAKYLFRPNAFNEREHYSEWNQFKSALNSKLHYYIVEQFQFVEIRISELEQRNNGIYAGAIFLGDTVEQAIERIYCDTYEDPYAYFSEMVSVSELEQAALSSDKSLRVRAFNTMFEHGEAVATIVNRVLRVIEVEEHEEMLMEITASHFDKLGSLDSDVKNRWLK